MGTAAAIFVALLGVLTVGPIPAPPAYADHNDMYLVCPSSITEGDSAFLEVRWPGYSSGSRGRRNTALFERV